MTSNGSTCTGITDCAFPAFLFLYEKEKSEMRM